MREFIYINRNKIRFYTLLHGIIWGVIILLLFWLLYSGESDEKITLSIWLAILLYIAIVITLISIFVFLFILDGWKEFRKKRDLFNQQNWSIFFVKQGFETVKILQKEKLILTQEAKLGHIKGYVVMADFSKEKKNHFQFRFFVGNDSANKEEYKRISKLLQPYNGGLEFGYLYKYIITNSSLTITQIEQELNQFADHLLVNGLIPTAK